MTDTELTESPRGGDATTAPREALVWTRMDDPGPSRAQLAEIEREAKQSRDESMVLPDWKRKHHNWKKGK